MRIIKTEEAQSLMKRCQRGVGGQGALDEAHGILADCYGTIGALVKERDQLRVQNDALARELLTPDVFQRLLDWLRETPPRPATAAFTAGIERQIAYALEMDVLPEVKRLQALLSRNNP